MGSIEWVKNTMPKSDSVTLSIMSLEEVSKARQFHSGFPMYTKTPLVELRQLAEDYNLKSICVKDESYRFGLNAFKVLGGSYAMARYIAKVLNRPIDTLDYEAFISPQLKAQLGEVTFYTATDGNHGRGVAWAANKLGQKAVVHMPKGSKAIRLENIQKEGACVTIEPFNYDECVRLAAKEAAEAPCGVIVQDTAWDGYEEIPTWIMQGYGTMAMEASEQIAHKPTHIFVQAGVGSLAGAVQGYFANLYKDDPPITVIIEAKEAACLYASAKGGDGAIRIVDGDMPTIMAGLACGEPNTLAWDILKNHSHYFVTCTNEVAAYGMRILGAPLEGDSRVISGESGAVGMGLLGLLMKDRTYAEFKEALGLDENAVVLMFSTEGDTDPLHYKEVVWNGKYSI